MIEQPKTVKDESPTKETVTTHPAYAQIGASRVSGHANLYDSEFTHQHYMTVTIRRSQLNRGLHRDWHFGGEDFIEVAMTEAQWATFVSAPNMGSGVPCTLQRRNGQTIPQLPPPPSRTDQFEQEMKDKMDALLSRLQGFEDRIDAMNLPKGKTGELKQMITAVHRELASNLPFIAGQFSEHMENTSEDAKAEIHGYMTSVLQRAGLEALASPDSMPLAIEHKPEEAA